ncbi:MAG: prepilin-type N-terminal cleavage/methylation domain-containing protein [Thermodesulfobacteriota bacterium]
MKKRIVSRYRGFTLIELIVVIVVVGILSALGGLIITNHMQGYVDMSNRAALVDSAESALRRMKRDVRAALPNSINASDGSLIFLHTVAGGRYRSKCPDSSSSCTNNQTLEFNRHDTSFAMIGKLLTNSSGAIIPQRIRDSSIVVYNTGNSKADAYSHTNNASIQGVDASASPGNDMSPSSNFTISSREFPFRSPYKRFQIVDSQVCYVREGRKLWRYQSNSIQNQGTCEGLGDPSLVARHVEDVNFDYEHGTATRAALLTVNATLSDAGERITLLHQIHVLNYP